MLVLSKCKLINYHKRKLVPMDQYRQCSNCSWWAILLEYVVDGNELPKVARFSTSWVGPYTRVDPQPFMSSHFMGVKCVGRSAFLTSGNQSILWRQWVTILLFSQTYISSSNNDVLVLVGWMRLDVRSFGTGMSFNDSQVILYNMAPFEMDWSWTCRKTSF